MHEPSQQEAPAQWWERDGDEYWMLGISCSFGRSTSSSSLTVCNFVDLHRPKLHFCRLAWESCCCCCLSSPFWRTRKLDLGQFFDKYFPIFSKSILKTALFSCCCFKAADCPQDFLSSLDGSRPSVTEVRKHYANLENRQYWSARTGTAHIFLSIIFALFPQASLGILPDRKNAIKAEAFLV